MYHEQTANILFLVRSPLASRHRRKPNMNAERPPPNRSPAPHHRNICTTCDGGTILITARSGDNVPIPARKQRTTTTPVARTPDDNGPTHGTSSVADRPIPNNNIIIIAFSSVVVQTDGPLESSCRTNSDGRTAGAEQTLEDVVR